MRIPFSYRSLMNAHFSMNKRSNQCFEVKDRTGNTKDVEDLVAVEEVIELPWLVVALGNFEAIYQCTGDVANGLVEDIPQLDSVDGLLDAEVEAAGDDGKKTRHGKHDEEQGSDGLPVLVVESVIQNKNTANGTEYGGQNSEQLAEKQVVMESVVQQRNDGC